MIRFILYLNFNINKDNETYLACTLFSICYALFLKILYLLSFWKQTKNKQIFNWFHRDRVKQSLWVGALLEDKNLRKVIAYGKWLWEVRKWNQSLCNLGTQRHKNITQFLWSHKISSRKSSWNKHASQPSLQKKYEKYVRC